MIELVALDSKGKQFCLGKMTYFSIAKNATHPKLCSNHDENSIAPY